MENHISGSWILDKNEVKPSISLLKEFSILEVKGEDAEAFLHGQFTNHIKKSRRVLSFSGLLSAARQNTRAHACR